MQSDPNLKLDLKMGCRVGSEGLAQEAKVKGFAWNGCLQGTIEPLSSKDACLARHTGVPSCPY